MALPVVSKMSLSRCVSSPILRMDAKQAAPECLELDAIFREIPTFHLGKYIPKPFVKGEQPIYMEEDDETDGAYVVSTLAVRPLHVNIAACKVISAKQFEDLSPARRLADGDVVLTVDGGTSIGKCAVFRTLQTAERGIPSSFTVESHVAIIRPTISADIVAHLLCSPIGQLQFQRAEAGASGQTSVSEADIRRFRFPQLSSDELLAANQTLESSLREARRIEMEAEKARRAAWTTFEESLFGKMAHRRKLIEVRQRPSEIRSAQISVSDQ